MLPLLWIQLIAAAILILLSSKYLVSSSDKIASKIGLGLTKEDFLKTPPIRDWIWWKNKDAPLTLGEGILRYQQDKKSESRRFIGMGALIILLFVIGMVAGF
mgnify:CR=1 FL=1